MKNTTKLAIGITTVILCISNFSFAQLAMGGVVPDRWVNTTNAPATFNVEAFGIGAFVTSPLSAFHINTNLLSTTPVFSPGEVFRTDCPLANATYWRMYRGGIQYGMLFNNFGSTDFQIQSPSGFLLLNTNGNFVGVNTSTPNQLFTVTGGNINVQSAPLGYMINDNYVLRHKGDPNNIFVGVNAGFFNTTGTRNTFLGNASGFANDGAVDNTFLGYRSGLTNTGVGGFGFQNSFMGSQSGMSNTTGYKNTFVGYNSGFSNKDGRDNVYVGNQSGFAGNVLTLVNENTFVGNQSGQNNQGSQHTFIGFQAGFTQSTQGVVGNTFVGYKSGFSNVGGGENAFFGYKSGYTNTASTNTFIGFRCGELNDGGTANAFLGSFAGNENTSGNENTFSGASAGRKNKTGNDNSFEGYNSGYSNISGYENTYGGANSGFSNIVGNRNTILGFDAGYFNNANSNTFIGDSTGYNNISGNVNTFVGSLAGFNNTIAQGNVFVGGRAGFFNVNGQYNTFTGTLCGYSNVNGGSNSFYGKEAGFLNIDGNYNCYFGAHCNFTANTGDQNTVMGTFAAYYNKMGNNNAFVGFESGYNTGFSAADDNNVAVGMHAGYNQRGSNNTFLGAFADEPTSFSLTNAAALGSNALVKSNNKMILGDTTVWVGIGLSNDNSPTLGPDNSLEINARTNTTGAIIPNTSGLRFRQLPGVAASLTAVNPGPGVLALSTSGDVIYVPSSAASGTPFFECNAGNNSANLPYDSEFNLSNWNFIFHDNGIGSGNNLANNVGIGLNPNNCTPVAKLEVQQNSGATASKGILITNNDPSSSPVVGSSIGIKSKMPLLTDFNRIAGWFETPVSAFGLGTAIYVPKNGGTVTLGFSNLPYTGNTLQVNGGIFYDVLTQGSDVTLKTNVQTVSNATAIIKRMRGVSFQWLASAIGDSSMYGTHYGFIAQEMDTVLPNVVHASYDGLKSISYTEIIPYLVKAIQEQSEKIDSLTNQINSCCTSNSRTQNPNINHTNVTLDNSQNIILNQNVPNPFAEQTVITYNLPETTQHAQLLFYDATGKLIKSVDLTDHGKGQVTVFANDLSNGIYSYALVVDGNIIDTKRMVKTN